MDFADEEVPASGIMLKVHQYQALYQTYLDKTNPYVYQRWGAVGFLLVIFMIRVVWTQGWYIICYGLGIFLLNQFLHFLTPKFDPSLQQDMENDEMEAGERGEEFRPFIRRLPEFKFWYNCMRATLISLVMSMFVIFDIPVFWPILLMYFIVLFALTMRRQIKHMIKYRYIPLDVGKKKYSSPGN